MKKTVTKVLSLLTVLALLAGLCACGSSEGSTTTEEKKTFTVGICQLVQHDALDAATQGFKDVLTEEFGDAITFEEGNAAGDSATCATICNGFVSSGVDLIMANATPALQAAASATNTIPVLGTSVSAYDVALSLSDFNGTVGGNISGTSDLAPMDVQADMIKELFPDAKTVGILYCSGEANSVFQVEAMTTNLEALGFTVSTFSFADSNDVSLVAATACEECDIIYIPTDNTAASCGSSIAAAADAANVPIFAAEEGLCTSTNGVATLSISYYELGKTTGQMAVKILKGEANISEMPVEYFADPVKKFNKTAAEKYGVTIPEGYEELQ